MVGLPLVLGMLPLGWALACRYASQFGEWLAASALQACADMTGAGLDGF